MLSFSSLLRLLFISASLMCASQFYLKGGGVFQNVSKQASQRKGSGIWFYAQDAQAKRKALCLRQRRHKTGGGASGQQMIGREGGINQQGDQRERQ